MIDTDNIVGYMLMSVQTTRRHPRYGKVYESAGVAGTYAKKAKGFGVFPVYATRDPIFAVA